MPSVNFLTRLAGAAPTTADPVPGWANTALKSTTQRIQDSLRLDCPELLQPANLDQRARAELHLRVQGVLLAHPDWQVPGFTLTALAEQVYQYVAGLGPLEALLADPDVSEIMVNGPADVWVERYGRLHHRPEIRFRDEMHVLYLCQRVFAPLGIELSVAHPRASGRLPGNIRVAASIPPISPTVTLNIRRPALEAVDTETYLQLGTATPEMLTFLQQVARGRLNFIVAGPTGTGKTTLIRYLGRFFDPGARVMVLEQVSELGLDRQHPHVVALEARLTGTPALNVTLQDLLEHSLHRRPEYLVVGEVLGAEAVQFFNALATGHPGCTSVHAHSPAQVFDRLAQAALQARLQMSEDAYRRALAGVIDVIVYVERMADGSRKITAITEVEGWHDGAPALRPLWEFIPEQVSSDRVEGQFERRAAPSDALLTRLRRWGVSL